MQLPQPNATERVGAGAGALFAALAANGTRAPPRPRRAPDSKLAENIGTGASADEVHTTFMASATHRRNIVDGAFGEIGVGVAWRDGRIWVTEVFRAPAGAVGAADCAPTGVVRRTADCAIDNHHRARPGLDGRPPPPPAPHRRRAAPSPGPAALVATAVVAACTIGHRRHHGRRRRRPEES